MRLPYLHIPAQVSADAEPSLAPSDHDTHDERRGTMSRYPLRLLLSILALVGAGATARAQRPAGGMMGMRHDSATMTQMSMVHELVVNHDRITRTVTNLPDGIRTVTESDDPAMAQRLKGHVAAMTGRVVAADDPGLPIESSALRTIYRNGDKIRTVVDTTARGLVVVQTSNDPVTVAALQQHASEVTDLVRDGMARMHQAMMKNGGGMMHRGMSGAGAADTTVMRHAAQDSSKRDSAFAAMQMRGKMAMGVDQYTSTHQFDALPTGGRIELQRNVDDRAGVAQIRSHLQEIAKAFKSGDFSTPATVHLRQVPGTQVMADRRAAIAYTYRALPRGGEVRIVTKDPTALKAIHEFMAFQRQDHRAGGMDHSKMSH